MSPYLGIIIAGFMIMLAALIGVVFSHKHLRNFITRNLPFLVSLSAGVFLFTAYNLGNESLHIGEEIGMKELPLISIFAGFLIFLLSQKLIPESHHHHEDDGTHHHEKRGILRMLWGDAIHNVGDGLILVPAFLTDIHIGIMLTIGILIHEALQEISEFFVLKNLGLSTKAALWRNFLVSTTIFVGIGIGFLTKGNETINTILLGFACGGFIYIVFHDLIPYQNLKNKHFWKHLVFFFIGFVLIFSVSKFMPHSHEEEHQNMATEERGTL